MSSATPMMDGEDDGEEDPFGDGAEEHSALRGPGHEGEEGEEHQMWAIGEDDDEDDLHPADPDGFADTARAEGSTRGLSGADEGGTKRPEQESLVSRDEHGHGKARDGDGEDEDGDEFGDWEDGGKNSPVR